MKKGFTLIELMVVIAIMAILTAILLPNIEAVRARSRDTKRIADISQLRLAIEHYFTIYNKYPLDIYSDSNFTNGGVVSNPVPTDPNGGNYQYVPYCNGAAVPNNFHLAATLEQNNDNLNADADINAPGTPPYQVCSGYADNINGTDTSSSHVFDLVGN